MESEQGTVELSTDVLASYTNCLLNRTVTPAVSIGAVPVKPATVEPKKKRICLPLTPAENLESPAMPANGFSFANIGALPGVGPNADHLYSVLASMANEELSLQTMQYSLRKHHHVDFSQPALARRLARLNLNVDSKGNRIEYTFTPERTPSPQPPGSDSQSLSSSGPGTYVCEICDQKVDYYSQLTRHFQRVHPGSELRTERLDRRKKAENLRHAAAMGYSSSAASAKSSSSSVNLLVKGEVKLSDPNAPVLPKMEVEEDRQFPCMLCPCAYRHNRNLVSHMQTKHPYAVIPRRKRVNQYL